MYVKKVMSPQKRVNKAPLIGDSFVCANLEFALYEHGPLRRTPLCPASKDLLEGHDHVIENDPQER